MRVCGNKQELIKWTVWHSFDRHFTVASSFFLCICVCVCICTRAHMCLCVCVCMRAHAYVCVHACACAHVCVCVCESVFACVCMCMCMRACVCVSVFVCVRVWVCVHEHMCVSFLWYRCLEVNVLYSRTQKTQVAPSPNGSQTLSLCPSSTRSLWAQGESRAYHWAKLVSVRVTFMNNTDRANQGPKRRRSQTSIFHSSIGQKSDDHSEKQRETKRTEGHQQQE